MCYEKTQAAPDYSNSVHKVYLPSVLSPKQITAVLAYHKEVGTIGAGSYGSLPLIPGPFSAQLSLLIYHSTSASFSMYLPQPCVSTYFNLFLSIWFCCLSAVGNNSQWAHDSGIQIEYMIYGPSVEAISLVSLQLESDVTG